MENWKTIENYERYYEISDSGNVRSLDRKYTDSLNRNVFKKGKNQKLYLRRDYYAVWLNKDNKTIPYSVHRLVAKYFLPKSEKPYVNHIDGNKLNNNSSNLEWCTAKENTHHAIINKLIVFSSGEKSRNVKLKENEVRFILSSNLTQQELANKFNVSSSNIGMIKRGLTWIELSKQIITEINKITESEGQNG